MKKQWKARVDQSQWGPWLMNVDDPSDECVRRSDYRRHLWFIVAHSLEPQS